MEYLERRWRVAIEGTGGVEVDVSRLPTVFPGGLRIEDRVQRISTWEPKKDVEGSRT